MTDFASKLYHGQINLQDLNDYISMINQNCDKTSVISVDYGGKIENIRVTPFMAIVMAHNRIEMGSVNTKYILDFSNVKKIKKKQKYSNVIDGLPEKVVTILKTYNVQNVPTFDVKLDTGQMLVGLIGGKNEVILPSFGKLNTSDSDTLEKLQIIEEKSSMFKQLVNCKVDGRSALSELCRIYYSRKSIEILTLLLKYTDDSILNYKFKNKLPIITAVSNIYATPEIKEIFVEKMLQKHLEQKSFVNPLYKKESLKLKI